MEKFRGAPDKRFPLRFKTAHLAMSDLPEDDIWGFNTLDLLTDFPSNAGDFSGLRRYIQVVNEFSPHLTAQRAIRIQAKISRETDPVRRAEMEGDLETIADDDKALIPRVVWGGVLVSIYAAYEGGIVSTLKYWQRSTKFPEEFKRLPKLDMLKSADSYSNRNLGISLFGSESGKTALADLKCFRNKFAHGSGLFIELPSDLRKKIENRAHPGLAIEVASGRWIANARVTAYYFLHAERELKRFRDTVVEKYLEFYEKRRGMA